MEGFRMKRKTLLVFGAIALVLAVTSGGLAANRWIITRSTQVKPGAISYKNLSRAAKKKLRGQRGQRGPAGVRGVAGPAGPAGTDALAQFGGSVHHGQTMCLAASAANTQGACLTSGYANDAKSIVFGPTPAGLTIQKLSAAASIAPNAGPVVVTVLNNGVATSLSCTIAKATTSCTDSAHSFTTAAGSFLQVRVSNDTTNAVNPRFAVTFAY